MFIPRHPVVEDQFCKYGATSTVGGVGNVLAYAGAIMYLDPTAAGEDSVIFKMAHGVTEAPFGFSMQKVKTGYQTLHPVGFLMPGDLGSSDAVAQPTFDSAGDVNGSDSVPVGVAHLGIWETTHYTALQTTTPGTVDDGDHLKPGQSLFSAANGARVTNSTVDSDGTDVNGERCSSVEVAKVLKGASAAKCTANIAGTTLTPIRIKILI